MNDQETVLRAMLRAYEEAALGATIAYFQCDDRDVAALHWANQRRDELDDATIAIRGELGNFVAGDHGRFDWPQYLHADYEARLRGDRPIDAPPEIWP